jgi:alpha-1,3-rhamnosyl/mannosyltransferase
VDGPVVTTMHDLSVLEHPHWHPADRVAQWNRRLRTSLQATTHWIVPSRFTARRMTELLGIEADHITVIPLAARSFAQPQREDAWGRGLPRRFILHLGTIEPRKNISLLLDAWQALPRPLRSELRLVLAGGIGWGTAADFQRLVEHPLAGEVLVTGYVSAQAIGLLLGRATALVACSAYEGFGLPILEAMSVGTPVICSNTDVFKEVAGDAARLCPHHVPTPWARTIEQLCGEPDLRNDLIAAGRQQAATYHWTTTAQKHLHTFTTVGEKA